MCVFSDWLAIASYNIILKLKLIHKIVNYIVLYHATPFAIEMLLRTLRFYNLVTDNTLLAIIQLSSTTESRVSHSMVANIKRFITG